MRKLGDVPLNTEKRETILREIQYWRRSKLLPEQYCDFLTNLYDEEGRERGGNPISLRNLEQGSIKVWLFGFGVISLILLIGFYFSVFPWGLQIATAISILVVCYGYAGVLRVREPNLSLILAGIGSLLTLLFGIWMIGLHDLTAPYWKPSLLALCGLLWCILGFGMRIGLLQFAGYGALCLLYAEFFGSVRPDAGIAELQLLWLPLCVLMIWLSWLLHHRISGIAGVYFAVGAALWLMPELDSLVLRGTEPDWLPTLLIAKIGIGLALLFGFRKKWMVWVTT